MRRTRIVCTIGPATASRRSLESLLRGGMDVARLNMSHGTQEWHRECIGRLRAARERLNRPLGILMDLQGVRLRITEVAEPGVVLLKGSKVLIRRGTGPTTADTIRIPHPRLLEEVKTGHRVLIDDGLVELRVTGKSGGALEAKVRAGGVLTSRKGVNLPDSDIRSGALTAKDRRDLAFGVEQGVDAFALSFVSGAKDVAAVKRALARAGCEAPVIAKIERPQAVANIGEILEAADGIMVARGDLGVEMSVPAVPVIQKELIRLANEGQRLVITATQMLESMTHSPVPTRAEAADVANAVLDGSDAVMLSGETSVGDYPVRALDTMAAIVLGAEERGGAFRAQPPVPVPSPGKGPEGTSLAVAHAAVRAAADVGARCIVAFTRSGYTARLLAWLRPAVPIIALTPDRRVVNRLKLTWGVVPLYAEHLGSTDAMIGEVERALVKGRYAGKGDEVVITASLPVSGTGTTNFLKVHRVAM